MDARLGSDPGRSMPAFKDCEAMLVVSSFLVHELCWGTHLSTKLRFLDAARDAAHISFGRIASAGNQER